MASMYAAPYVNGSNTATAYPNNNYIYKGAPPSPVPGSYGVTPAQILSTAIQTSTKQTHNPYARPVSVTEIHPPGYYGQQSSLQSSSSGSSISSTGSASNGIPVTTCPPSLGSGKASPSIQTNSFMRPTTATRRKQAEKVDSNGNSKAAITHKSMTPSATLTTVEIMEGGVSALAITPTDTTAISRPSSAGKPAVVPRPPSAKNIMVKPNTEVKIGPGDSSFEVIKRPPLAPRGVPRINGDLSNRSASDAHYKATTTSPQAKSSPTMTNNKPPPSPLSSKTAKRQLSSRPEGSQKVTTDSSSVDSGDSRPGSGSTIRPGTPAAEIAAKVRNLNYTPTKPYSEVDINGTVGTSPTTTSVSPVGSESNLKKVHTFVPRNTNMKNNVTKTSSEMEDSSSGKKNSASTMNPHLDAEDLDDPSLKKMPVTNTLTGTIYYRKASKSEEVSTIENIVILRHNNVIVKY